MRKTMELFIYIFGVPVCVFFMLWGREGKKKREGFSTTQNSETADLVI